MYIRGFLITVILSLFIFACSDSHDDVSVNSSSYVQPVPTIKAEADRGGNKKQVESQQQKLGSIDDDKEAGSYVTLILGEDSTAKYSIGERLARFDTPITAEGITTSLIGELRFDAEGNPTENSLIKIDATSFKSDENKRDNWVRRNGGLGQEITFLVTDFQDLPWPLPSSDSATFVITGDMTVSGTTVSTSWDTTADFSAGEIVGVAKTSITWDQFNLSKPRLPFIISVDDEIFLELNFKTAR